MRKMMLAVSLTAFLFLPGCKDEKEVKTVQWYTEHKAERKAQLDICKDNPGQLKDDPNCINAMQSVVSNSGGSVRDLNLPKPQ